METIYFSQNTSQVIKWSECLLCQELTGEKLTCPANSKRSNSGVGYATIAENILRYNELQLLPFNIGIGTFTKDGSLESALKSKHASWHKSCYSKISSTKIMAALRWTENPSPKKMYTRRSTSLGVSFEDTGVCLFCGEDVSANNLHEVFTFKLDYRVRRCAHDLKDQGLIAKLSSVADLTAQEATYHTKCLNDLYSRAQRSKTQDTTEEDNSYRSIALAELITYLKECRHETDTGTFR